MTILRERSPTPAPSNPPTAETTDWASVRVALRDWLVDYPVGRALWLRPVPAEDVAHEALARFLALKRRPSGAKMMPALQRIALRVLFPNHEDETVWEAPRYPTPKPASYVDYPVERLDFERLAYDAIFECDEQDWKIWEAFKNLAGRERLPTVREVAQELGIDTREVRAFITRAKRNYKAILEKTAIAPIGPYREHDP